MQKVTITIEPTGEDTIELEGFHGKGCMKLIEQLADGDRPSSVRHKREYSEVQPQQEKARS